MEQKQSLIPLRELLVLSVCELIFSALLVGVYAIIGRFSYTVITGSALGIFVTLLNFIILSVSVGHAFDKALLARGDKELTEEEIEKFTSEQNAAMQAAAKGSFIIRTVLMLAVLIISFISGYFDVIATLLPLVLFRPIITVDALIKERREMRKYEAENNTDDTQKEE